MNPEPPEPPEPPPPTHHITVTIQLANGSTAIIAFPLIEEATQIGLYYFRPDGPNRIALITPLCSEGSPPIVFSPLHGLDWQTATRLLGELALSTTMISPPNQGPKSIPQSPEPPTP